MPTLPTRLALLVALAATPACGPQPDAHGEAAPVEVVLGRSRLVALPRTVELTGSLLAREDVALSARVAGRVAAVLADVGDRVAPGAELARLDPLDFRLEVERRATALESALARLGLVAPPGEGFDPSAVPEVQRARQHERNAEARLRRAEGLRHGSSRLISEQDYEDVATAWAVAKADIDVALQQALALAADAHGRAAELAIAQKALDDTVAHAPPDGRGWAVAERLVAPGEQVARGEPLFRLVDDALVKFRAGVPERYLGRIAIGQALTLWVEAQAQPFSGRVTRLSPDVRPDSRTFLVEAELDNADRRLAPGAFARGMVTTHVEPGVTLVPAAAVVTFAGVSRVFTVEGGRAVEHRVDARAAGEGELEIISGFGGEGDVVVAGAERLAQGVAVTLLAPGLPP